MATYHLHFTLKSDTTFGRGDGLAGAVDREVAHDEHGFPYLNGRALKGLLTEECDSLLELLHSHSLLPPERLAELVAARDWIFGIPGSRTETTGALHVGHAQLPPHLRAAIRAAKIPPADVLNSLTAIRRQSAINMETGAPAASTLRATRVILRETLFVAEINAPHELGSPALDLLASSVLHWRRAGSLRNRGRGRLIPDLTDGQGHSVLTAGLKLLEVPS